MRLLHICQWGKNRKLAWSGTYNSIYKQLIKHYDVVDYCLKSNLYLRSKQYLVNKRTPLLKFDFGYTEIKRNTKMLMNKLQGEKICTFQYSEFPFGENIHSYIYQDMCIDYFYHQIYPNVDLMKNFDYRKVSKKALLKRLAAQKEFYGKCSGIFTMNKWLADYMINDMKIEASKIHHVGAGIDIDINKLQKKKKSGNKILFIGRSFKRKGGTLVLEAFKELRKTMPEAELFIVGPRKNPLKSNVPGIIFVGSQNSEQLMEYYSNCDIFCMPSYIEPFGKVFIEALCCGLPCIARNSFAMKEIIKDGVNGYLINDDNVEELADKMRDLLCNNQIKDYVISQQQHYQNEYSWETVMEKIRDVINKDSYICEDD